MTGNRQQPGVGRMEMIEWQKDYFSVARNAKPTYLMRYTAHFGTVLTIIERSLNTDATAAMRF